MDAKVKADKPKKKKIELFKIIIFLIMLLLLVIYVVCYRIAEIRDLGRTAAVAGDKDINGEGREESLDINAGNTGNTGARRPSGSGAGQGEGEPLVTPEPEEPYPQEYVIKITDRDATWKFTQDLNVFSNKLYHNARIIAPGFKGAYEFNIENVSDGEIECKIDFIEKNLYSINMRYRLKVGRNIPT